MALYHLSSQIISRSDNRNVVAAAAYRAGESLTTIIRDKDIGISIDHTFDYTKKRHIVYKEIFAPARAPKFVYDRETLWNMVEQTEKRKDAQLAREIDVAFPKELNIEQAKLLLQEYVKEVFVEKGMVADASIHWESGNPHAHIMLTMRTIHKHGFGLKNTDWNRKSFLFEVRSKWAEITNQHLKNYGIDERIDHRSYKEQNLGLIATIHEGVQKHLSGWLERVGYNENVKEQNKQRIGINPDLAIERLSARKLTFTKADIACEVFNLTLGDEEAFHENYQKALTSEKLHLITEKDLKGETRYTTKLYVNIENRFWSNVETLANRQTHYVKQAIANNRLSNEQKAVLEQTLSGKDLTLIIGRAGSGKTTTISSIAKNYTEAGYAVIGAALSGVATDNLASQNIEAHTIAKWLKDLDSGKTSISKNNIFILDEASMIDIVSMEKLLSHAAKSKIILVGDDTQIQPIEKGGVFRAMLGKQHMQTLKLEQIWRQTKEYQKEATTHMANREIETAIKAYKGNINNTHDTKEEAIRAVAKEYVEDHLKTTKSQLAITYTGDSAHQINMAIRDDLKLLGTIQNETSVLTKHGYIDVGVGDKIVFLENNKILDIRNGNIGVVQNIDRNEILKVRISDNKTISLNPEEYNNFAYGYAVTTHKAQGVTIDKTYALIEPYHNFNSINVAMTRHRDDISIYVPKTTAKDIAGLIKLAEREEIKEVVEDYVDYNPGKANARVEIFKEYMAKIEDGKILYNDIKTWANKEHKSHYEHRKWSRYQSLVERRNNLAKIIYANKDDYRLYLTQTSISVSAIKYHAGEAVYKPTKEEQLYQDLITAYRQTPQNHQEQQKLAYVISKDLAKFRNSLRKSEIYEIKILAANYAKNHDVSELAATLKTLKETKAKLENYISAQAKSIAILKDKASILEYKNELIEKRLTKIYEEPIAKFVNIFKNLDLKANIKANPEMLGNMKISPNERQKESIAASILKYEKNTREINTARLNIKTMEADKVYNTVKQDLEETNDKLGPLAGFTETKVFDRIINIKELTPSKATHKPTAIKEYTNPDCGLYKSSIMNVIYKERDLRDGGPNFGLVYQNADDALKKFDDLVSNKGLEYALHIAKTKPQTFGKLNGRGVLMFKDYTRAYAESSLERIHHSFANYQKLKDAKISLDDKLKAMATRYIEPLVKGIQQKGYNDLISYLSEHNKTAMPAYEGKVSDRFIEDASKRMSSYILDYRAKNQSDLTNFELGVIFNRSMLETEKFRHRKDLLDAKNIRINEYIKELTTLERLASIEGKLYQDDCMNKKIDVIGYDISCDQLIKCTNHNASQELAANNAKISSMETTFKDLNHSNPGKTKDMALHLTSEFMASQTIRHREIYGNANHLQKSILMDIQGYIRKEAEHLIQNNSITNIEARFILEKQGESLYKQTLDDAIRGKSIHNIDNFKTEARKAGNYEYNAIKLHFIKTEQKQMTHQQTRDLIKTKELGEK